MVPFICFLQNVSFSFSTLLEFGRANLCVSQIGILTSNLVWINPCCTMCDIFLQFYSNQILRTWYITLFQCIRFWCCLTRSVFKKLFCILILAKNKVKIVVNILWFAAKNHIFANEQKWHVGKLRSWVIIIVPHVEWTLVYFYSCHSNGALKTTLSVLFNF